MKPAIKQYIDIIIQPCDTDTAGMATSSSFEL